MYSKLSVLMVISYRKQVFIIYAYMHAQFATTHQEPIVICSANYNHAKLDIPISQFNYALEYMHANFTKACVCIWKSNSIFIFYLSFIVHNVLSYNIMEQLNTFTTVRRYRSCMYFSMVRLLLE
jgi:hypothetical protein